MRLFAGFRSQWMMPLECASSSFSLKTLDMLVLEMLYGDDTIEPRVACLPHLSHACSDGRKQFVRSKLTPGCHSVMISKFYLESAHKP